MAAYVSWYGGSGIAAHAEILRMASLARMVYSDDVACSLEERADATWCATRRPENTQSAMERPLT
jgi:hypothetical protein